MGGIIFNQDLTEILLVKGKEHGKWGPPKGHLEKNESELEGGLREIKEETGISILLEDPKTTPSCVRVMNTKLFIFNVIDKEKLTLNYEDINEIDEISWKKIDQLNMLDSTNRILKEIIRRISTIKQKAITNKIKV